MKKIMFFAMLIASFSLWANGLKIENNLSKDIKKEKGQIESSFILIKKGPSALSWVHCRVALNESGQRYYKWCRTETMVSGKIKIHKYLDPKYYPPIPESSIEEQPDEPGKMTKEEFEEFLKRWKKN